MQFIGCGSAARLGINPIEGRFNYTFVVIAFLLCMCVVCKGEGLYVLVRMHADVRDPIRACLHACTYERLFVHIRVTHTQPNRRILVREMDLAWRRLSKKGHAY